MLIQHPYTIVSFYVLLKPSVSSPISIVDYTVLKWNKQEGIRVQARNICIMLGNVFLPFWQLKGQIRIRNGTELFNLTDQYSSRTFHVLLLFLWYLDNASLPLKITQAHFCSRIISLQSHGKAPLILQQ